MTRLKGHGNRVNNEWAGEIQLNQMQLMSQVFNKGVGQFKEGKYAEALVDFEIAQAISPNDTATILNSAYAAERAGNKAKAKQYYEKLVSMNYQDDKSYAALSNLYREDGNTDKALEVLRQGRTAMPESINLMLAEINILLSTGKSQEATTALDAAIQKDPKNRAFTWPWAARLTTWPIPKVRMARTRRNRLSITIT